MPTIRPSARLQRLPPYLFAELERKQRKLREQGKDVIDISIGDPDQAAPERVREALVRHLRDKEIDTYPTTHGTDAFRVSVCEWMKRRYGVELAMNQVLLCVGSKEVIAHAPLALTDPGDVVLIPEPGYPPYRSGTIFALAEPYVMPLQAKAGFLPDLDAIPPDIRKRARILYVNYPNNPTGAVAPLDFYRRVVEFARKNDVMVIADNAYGELYYETPPVSFLSAPGASEVGIEIHSMTKSFNMAGWRIAWAVGNAQIIEILRGFKANCDSGQFKAIQLATAEVLRGGDKEMETIRNVYRERRDVFVQGMRAAGWDVQPPPASIYVWFRTPGGLSSAAMTERLLEEAHVVVTPGAGFGAHGEGFIRVALTEPATRLKEATARIAGLKV
ncbi:MAG TPA: aminotransferase class I/II-fold pyridoxal phosphate-dependent enzyme [Planctomycetota bacterium]|nr:aminotransferase class I/II-fold pyridoxal phosphate-dependent enzyme [Planctomycetota bacterium]